MILSINLGIYLFSILNLRQPRYYHFSNPCHASSALVRPYRCPIWPQQADTQPPQSSPSGHSSPSPYRQVPPWWSGPVSLCWRSMGKCGRRRESGITESIARGQGGVGLRLELITRKFWGSFHRIRIDLIRIADGLLSSSSSCPNFPNK